MKCSSFLKQARELSATMQPATGIGMREKAGGSDGDQPCIRLSYIICDIVASVMGSADRTVPQVYGPAWRQMAGRPSQCQEGDAALSADMKSLKGSWRVEVAVSWGTIAHCSLRF